MRIGKITFHNTQKKTRSQLELKVRLTRVEGNYADAELFSPILEKKHEQIMHVIHENPDAVMIFLHLGKETFLHYQIYTHKGEPLIPHISTTCLKHIGWWNHVREKEERLIQIEPLQKRYRTPSGCNLVEALLLAGKEPSLTRTDNQAADLAMVAYGKTEPNLKTVYHNQQNISFNGEDFKDKGERKVFPLLSWQAKKSIPKETEETLKKLIRETIDWGFKKGKKPKAKAVDALWELRPDLENNTQSWQSWKIWKETITSEELTTLFQNSNESNGFWKGYVKGTLLQESLESKTPILKEILHNLNRNLYCYKQLHDIQSIQLHEIPSEFQEKEKNALKKHIRLFGIEETTKAFFQQSETAELIFIIDEVGCLPQELRIPAFSPFIRKYWNEIRKPDNQRHEEPQNIKRRTSAAIIIMKWAPMLAKEEDTETLLREASAIVASAV